MKSVTLRTLDESNHELVILPDHGQGMTFKITPDQLMLLMYQASGTMWTWYRLKPRDNT